MNHKLAVLVNKLSSSQLAFYFILNGNRFIDENPKCDLIGMYEVQSKACINPNFAIMPSAELYSFDGVAVATNMSTAAKLLRCPSPCRKYFYVWDVEYLRIPGISYGTLRALYGSKELNLCARSEDHARVLRNAFNRDVKVITFGEMHEWVK